MDGAAVARGGLLARVEGHSVGQGWGHSSWLPQPSVPPRQHRRDPIPLQGLRGQRCHDRVFY